MNVAMPICLIHSQGGDAAANEDAAEKQLLDQQADPAEESQAAADGRSIYVGSVRRFHTV